jgi:hypothetical protein
VRNKLKFETETGAYRINASIAAEKTLIDQQLKEKIEELRRRPYDFKVGNA